MATLRGTFIFLARRSRLFVCPRQRFLSTTAVASGAWNQDWQPGPLPRTPEERAAAAKKYGLRPEDYNSLSNGDIGDYPDLPIVSRERRDPHEDFDFTGERRNFREPIHPRDEIIGVGLHDKDLQKKYTYAQSVTYFLLIFAGLTGIFLFFEQYPVNLPRMPKQYPFNNLYLEHGGDPALEPEVKHYTFVAAQDN